jgi:molybdopterin molybdotransferase
MLPSMVSQLMRLDTRNINKKKPKQFKIIGSIAAGNKPLSKKLINLKQLKL